MAKKKPAGATKGTKGGAKRGIAPKLDGLEALVRFGELLEKRSEHRYFGSVNALAEELGYGKSFIFNNHISNLEKWCGAKIMIKADGHLMLTRDGEELLAPAREIIRRHRTIRVWPLVPQVVIGTTNALARLLLPDLLEKFQARVGPQNEAQVVIREFVTRGEFLQELRRRGIDIGLRAVDEDEVSAPEGTAREGGVRFVGLAREYELKVAAAQGVTGAGWEKKKLRPIEVFARKEPIMFKGMEIERLAVDKDELAQLIAYLDKESQKEKQRKAEHRDEDLLTWPEKKSSLLRRVVECESHAAIHSLVRAGRHLGLLAKVDPDLDFKDIVSSPPVFQPLRVAVWWQQDHIDRLSREADQGSDGSRHRGYFVKNILEVFKDL
jgi:DNA-binding transcriptional LysR family regulator